MFGLWPEVSLSAHLPTTELVSASKECQSFEILNYSSAYVNEFGFRSTFTENRMVLMVHEKQAQ